MLSWIQLIDHTRHVGTQPCAVSGSILEVAISIFTIMTLPKNFLRNECQAIHDQWFSSLKDLKVVTHPESRKMLIENLRDLYSRATGLLERHGEQLDPISSSLLHHITSRSLDGHIAIAKNTENLVKVF